MTEPNLQEELLKAQRFKIKKLKKKLKKRDVELRARDEKIEKLQRTIENLPGGWSTPSLDEVDVPELPLPRLEVRWYQYFRDQRPEDWSSYRIVYQLVYQHLLDNIVAVPLGWTTVNGHDRDTKPWDEIPGFPSRGDEEARPPQVCRLPMRDGAHMFHDAAHLGLPLYIVPPEGEPRRLDVPDMSYYHRHHINIGHKHRREEGHGQEESVP